MAVRSVSHPDSTHQRAFRRKKFSGKAQLEPLPDVDGRGSRQHLPRQLAPILAPPSAEQGPRAAEASAEGAGAGSAPPVVLSTSGSGAAGPSQSSSGSSIAGTNSVAQNCSTSSSRKDHYGGGRSYEKNDLLVPDRHSRSVEHDASRHRGDHEQTTSSDEGFNSSGELRRSQSCILPARGEEAAWETHIHRARRSWVQRKVGHIFCCFFSSSHLVCLFGCCHLSASQLLSCLLARTAGLWSASACWIVRPFSSL